MGCLAHEAFFPSRSCCEAVLIGRTLIDPEDSTAMSDATSDPIFGAAASQDPFQAAKASAMKAAEELRNVASQKAQELRSAAEQKASQFKSVAQERAGEFREYADQAFDDAKARYSDIREETEGSSVKSPCRRC